MKDLPTKYDPHQIEERIYKEWSDRGFFRADDGSPDEPFCIVIPPPNITGILHMGHALNNTIQDILIRWKRMQGKDSLWMPGTDHAGIATQNVVERALAKKGLKRQQLGRDKFLEKVWEWKEEYGSTIIRQLKRLGCSCDWERTRFTMDEGLSEAVREVFVRLYGDGLLYKGDYIINWCVRCGTALSDEEAEHREVDGALYYVKYPVKGRQRLDKENEDYVVVATTRPETMLGDVAVAVNPEDPRYKDLHGKTLVLPIVGREIKVVLDDAVDPSFGTGALKVTPAHDPVDFEMGKRHGLDVLNVMDPGGVMNASAGDYEGMDRFECREAIVEDLKNRKLFIKSEPHRHAVGHCYRCHTVVEPRLSKQWFVRMKPLAEEAIKVVRAGDIRFHPARWEKVYLNWMENIRDWCISRQIWWGHRIPVWYCKDCLQYADPRDVDVTGAGQGGVYVGTEPPDKCGVCGSGNMEQDPDVLDTWFSSWLWPFSTLGWPEETDALRKFYPTNALVTAQEIIFFWVARMIMAGLKFRGKIPFRDVYIHGTVRDATGTKMSKSLGNVIDPLDVIGEVGSDALRFSIISITSQGQDVFLSRDKFDIGRNFANKIWNAARYVLMSLDDAAPDTGSDPAPVNVADKWILSEFTGTASRVTQALEVYRFNDATLELYDFVWHKYCDWYLEMSKLSQDRSATQAVLLKVLDGILRLMHPFMPFLTEEIWHKLPGKEDDWIINAAWPSGRDGYMDESAVADMNKLMSVITAIRNIRAFWNIDHTSSVDIVLEAQDKGDRTLLKDSSLYIERLVRGKIKKIGEGVDRPERSVVALAGTIKVYIPLGELIDVDKEKERVGLKVKDIEKYLTGIGRKLSNRSFLEKAPEEVVAKEKEKQRNFEGQLEQLRENLRAFE